MWCRYTHLIMHTRNPCTIIYLYFIYLNIYPYVWASKSGFQIMRCRYIPLIINTRHPYTNIHLNLQVLNLKNNQVRSFAGTRAQPRLTHVHLALNPLSQLVYYRPMCVHAFRPIRIGVFFRTCTCCFKSWCFSYVQMCMSPITHICVSREYMGSEKYLVDRNTPNQCCRFDRNTVGILINPLSKLWWEYNGNTMGIPNHPLSKNW